MTIYCSPLDVNHSFAVSSFIPKLFTVEDVNYSFSNTGFFSQNSDKKWTKIETPFDPREGMSVTPCGTSIVFFGGIKQPGQHVKAAIFKNRSRKAELEQSFSQSSSSSHHSNKSHTLDYIETTTNFSYYLPRKKKAFTNEMWIYDNGSWIPILTDLKPRAYHSSCYIPETNSICFIGGCTDNSAPIEGNAALNMNLLSTGINFKLPSALKSVESYEFLNQITIFNLTTNEAKNIKPIFTPNPNTPSKYLQKVLPIGTATCAYDDHSICIFGGKDPSGENRNEIYMCNLTNGQLTEQEYPVLPIDKFMADSFISENKLFVFSGFANNKYSPVCWIYDFDHSTWLLYDIRKIFLNGTFLIKTDKGIQIYNSQMTEYIDINFLDDMVGFFTKIIDDNLNSNIYDATAEMTLDYCKALFDSCIDNFTQLVDTYRKAQNPPNPGGEAPIHGDGSQDDLDEFIDLLKEYNSLQFASFKLDEMIVNKPKKQQNTKVPPEPISKNERKTATADEISQLISDYKKLKTNMEKERIDQINKQEDLASYLDSDVEVILNQSFANFDDFAPSEDFSMHEKREITAVSELGAEIQEQAMLMSNLQNKIREVRSKTVPDEMIMNGYLQIDKLDEQIYEARRKYRQQTEEQIPVIIESDERWLEQLQKIRTTPSGQKEDLVNAIKQFCFSSTLDHWEKIEKKEFQQLMQNVDDSFIKLKTDYDIPVTDQMKLRLLGMNKSIYDAVEALYQRADHSIKNPPSDSNYWEEVYNHITQTLLL